MTPFEKWRDRYERSWCTKGQLQRLTQLGVLTENEYREITGDKYPA